MMMICDHCKESFFEVRTTEIRGVKSRALSLFPMIPIPLSHHSLVQCVASLTPLGLQLPNRFEISFSLVVNFVFPFPS
jgi:hypothetical protein